MNHHMMSRREALVAAAALGTGSAWLPAAAQAPAFPVAPVRLIVPFPAGGSLDVVARPMAEPFQQMTGQPLIVENVAGANGLIAGARVAQSKPDGHTLFLASNAQVSLAPLLNAKMSYDPHKDLVPIMHVVDQLVVLYVSAKSPYNSVADVVAAARRSPGKIDVASSGLGSLPHLAMELFAQLSGLKFNHVPYKGGAPAIQAVAAGEVPLTFTAVGTAKALTTSGHVRPLAVASAKRGSSLPDLPTFAELGFTNMQVAGWMGLMGPSGMPESTVQRLSEVSRRILALPNFQAILADNAMEARGGTPADLHAFIQADANRWAPVVKRLDLKQ
jgi:tripartite-type tricarboxylate transporter receptor subunit TctC